MLERLDRETQSLREYQQSLLERMRNAEAGSASTRSRLAFEAGGRRWMMRLEEAQEVVRPGEIAAVPLARAWFRGLTNLRGNLISVIDLGCLAGGGLAPLGPDARLLLLAERYRLGAALLVDGVIGLRSLSGCEPAALERGLPNWILECHADPEGARWHEISIGGLVQSAEFLQTGL